MTHDMFGLFGNRKKRSSVTEKIIISKPPLNINLSYS